MDLRVRDAHAGIIAESPDYPNASNQPLPITKSISDSELEQLIGILEYVKTRWTPNYTSQYDIAKALPADQMKEYAISLARSIDAAIACNGPNPLRESSILPPPVAPFQYGGGNYIDMASQRMLQFPQYALEHTLPFSSISARPTPQYQPVYQHYAMPSPQYGLPPTYSSRGNPSMAARALTSKPNPFNLPLNPPANLPPLTLPGLPDPPLEPPTLSTYPPKPEPQAVPPTVSAGLEMLSGQAVSRDRSTSTCAPPQPPAALSEDAPPALSRHLAVQSSGSDAELTSDASMIGRGGRKKGRAIRFADDTSFYLLVCSVPWLGSCVGITVIDAIVPVKGKNNHALFCSIVKEGGTGHSAGLRAGDCIVQIEGQDVTALTSQELLEDLRSRLQVKRVQKLEMVLDMVVARSMIRHQCITSPKAVPSMAEPVRTSLQAALGSPGSAPSSPVAFAEPITQPSKDTLDRGRHTNNGDEATTIDEGEVESGTDFAEDKGAQLVGERAAKRRRSEVSCRENGEKEDEAERTVADSEQLDVQECDREVREENQGQESEQEQKAIPAREEEEKVDEAQAVAQRAVEAEPRDGSEVDWARAQEDRAQSRDQGCAGPTPIKELDGWKVGDPAWVRLGKLPRWPCKIISLHKGDPPSAQFHLFGDSTVETLPLSSLENYEAYFKKYYRRKYERIYVRCVAQSVIHITNLTCGGELKVLADRCGLHLGPLYSYLEDAAPKTSELREREKSRVRKERGLGDREDVHIAEPQLPLNAMDSNFEVEEEGIREGKRQGLALETWFMG